MSKILYNEARKEDRSTGCFYAEDVKVVRCKTGTHKAEVYVEQSTDSFQAFSDGLGINVSRFTPSLLGPFNVWDVKVVC